jgi:hypothetical protein
MAFANFIYVFLLLKYNICKEKSISHKSEILHTELTHVTSKPYLHPRCFSHAPLLLTSKSID